MREHEINMFFELKNNLAGSEIHFSNCKMTYEKVNTFYELENDFKRV